MKITNCIKRRIYPKMRLHDCWCWTLNRENKNTNT